jgi:hypothetical protein
MRKNHVVPTHLRVPETVLTFGSVSLSVRQFLLLLLGAALSYNLWLHLKVLATLPGGQAVRLMLALVPVLVALAFAFVRLVGRTLDRWLLVLLLFWHRPRCLVWRSVRFQEPNSAFGGVFQEQEENDA